MLDAHLPLLRDTPLFAGFTPEELTALLAALNPALRRYAKGEALLLAGDTAREIGVVLSGTAEAVKYTQAGGHFTVQWLGPGRVFGDVLSGGGAISPVTVTATAPLSALLLPAKRLFAAAPGKGELMRRLLANLVGVISDKYFALDRRVDLLLTHGLRRRIAAFLLSAAPQGGSLPFTLPMNRSQLANYLGCERSALSRELGRMARAGLIEVHRSTFRLADMDALRQLF